MTTWRRASTCHQNGTCIELAWRTSSHSGIENCIEIARGIAIRDSKNPEDPYLYVGRRGFRALLTGLQATA